MVKQSQLRIPECAVKCINGKIYFIQDGTLMCYAGGKTQDLQIACGSSYDVYEDAVYWIGQDNFNSEIYKQKIGGGIRCSLHLLKMGAMSVVLCS